MSFMTVFYQNGQLSKGIIGLLYLLFLRWKPPNDCQTLGQTLWLRVCIKCCLMCYLIECATLLEMLFLSLSQLLFMVDIFSMVF